MARASVPASKSEILRERERLAFHQGSFDYLLVTDHSKSILTVNDGHSSRSSDLLWAMGAAHMGQTYIFKQNDDFYESRLSFYGELQSLDITPGHSREEPSNLEVALGVKQKPVTEIYRCFGCHTTNSMSQNEFDPGLATPGLSCEACHGPGAKHVGAVKSGVSSPSNLIFNPSRLDPGAQIDFCGACHRTWQDVVGNYLLGIGVLNVRFAPYRLENSKCWKTQDARLGCISCHDPHKPLARDSKSYDSRCMQCHAVKGGVKTAAKQEAACPVSTTACVTCHMPKVELPDLHSTFTDHWIRIVKPGTPYPN